MNKSIKFSVAVVGIYACTLCFLHGFFEILQGFKKTGSILIYAIGRNNQEHEMWHGNFPAMTIIPNYLITGILVSIISLATIYYLLGKRKFKTLILVLISIIILLTGGGFVPFFLMLIVSFSTLLINKKFILNKEKKKNKTVNIVWIISIVLLILWFVAEWILGFFFNSILVSISTILFLFGITLPVFIIFMGAINDKLNGY